MNKMTNVTKATPFIKWVGGKTQILSDIHSYFPNKISTYYELFLGGGSVLISLLESEVDVKTYKVYDINPHLIQCYVDIQQNHLELLNRLSELTEIFRNASEYKAVPREKIPIHETLEDASVSRTHLYYYIRSEYNKLMKHTRTKSQNIQKSCYFIFLNKTGWRGVYRESKNGYNVPYGNYKNPLVYDEKNIHRLHELFSNVQFYVKDFKTFKPSCLNKLDFVYIDSPYYPVNTTSFTKYTEKDFGPNDHEQLFDLCKRIDRKCLFLLSNSCVEWTLETYNIWDVVQIMCKRHINSKNPESTAMEIFVSNKN